MTDYLGRIAVRARGEAQALHALQPRPATVFESPSPLSVQSLEVDIGELASATAPAPRVFAAEPRTAVAAPLPATHAPTTQSLTVEPRTAAVVRSLATHTLAIPPPVEPHTAAFTPPLATPAVPPLAEPRSTGAVPAPTTHAPTVPPLAELGRPVIAEGETPTAAPPPAPLTIKLALRHNAAAPNATSDAQSVEPRAPAPSALPQLVAAALDPRPAAPPAAKSAAALPRRRASAIASERAPSGDQVVQVTIGRIDVRTAVASPPPAPPPPREPMLTLAEYLRGGKR